jgi:hypothetical protein
MKILLVDIDSRKQRGKDDFPNLALMKISAYHKSLGDTVSLGRGISDPDIVYASIIFDWNRTKANSLHQMFPDAEIRIGGSGYDLKNKLPTEIELIHPDYSLYPELKYSVGFTSRGCIRNCHFCVVPEKEGKWKKVQHPSVFHDKTKKQIMLLDNNILVNKKWFFEVTDWILENDLKCDFNQGFDARLMTHDFAERICELKPMTSWKFAFDDWNYANDVEKTIELMNMCRSHIIRNRCQFYVYCDNDKQYWDAVYRIKFLKDRDAMPYSMINRSIKQTDRVKKLNYATRPQIISIADPEEVGAYKKTSTLHDCGVIE